MNQNTKKIQENCKLEDVCQVDLSDVYHFNQIVSAEFRNPSLNNKLSYGFSFRTRGGDTGEKVIIRVPSKNLYYYKSGTTGDPNLGITNDVKYISNEKNKIQVILKEYSGYIFINDEFQNEINIGTSGKGLTRAISHFFTNDDDINRGDVEISEINLFYY
mgnify:CR=1 FL=1